MVDGYIGLLSVDVTTGESCILSVDAEGLKFGFADFLTISSDGTIYFSDATSLYTPSNYILDFLSGSGNGRLVKYDPKTKTTTTLLNGKKIL